MTFRMKPVVQGLAAAFGGLALAGGVPLPANAQQQQQQLERVEITGSNIRRTDVETIQPVAIISREDIERSGRSTVAELLQSLPVASAGSFSEALGAGNSFSPGTAAISLRGLGSNATLVLINGRRVANYPFAQNIDEAFADLNSIPVTAIERIDILKSGASAIYGSDAIAGVVNVILRKDFRGLEVSGRTGTTQDGGGTEYGATLAAGFGSLAKDRFNIMGTVDYFQRDKIVGEKDRSYATANQESRGGFDFRSPTGNPGSWIRGTGAAQTIQPFANCPPDRIVPDAVLNGSGCYYNFASDNWLLPKTERIGFYGRGTFEFTQSLAAFAEYSWANNLTNQSAAPTPGSGTVPAANPSNPFGETVTARFRFTEVGPRLNEIDNTNQRLVAGLRGTVGSVDWEAAGFWSKQESTNTGTNYIDQRLVNQAFAGTVPGFVGTYWNLLGTNPAGLVNALRVTPVRKGEYETKGVDAKGSMELFDMAGGKAAVAFGAEFRQEELSDTPDPLSRLGVIVGSGGTSSKADRDITSAYAEVSLPVFKNFESQFALRFDDYSDYGNSTTGKVAFGYRPATNVLLRAGWASGFRAPSLVQTGLGQSISFPSLVDNPRCNAYRAATGTQNPPACGAQQVRSASGGNPNLEAEESDSINLGIVWEPMRDLSMSVDYYNIKHTNIIDQPTQAFLLNNPSLFPAGAVNRLPASPADIAAGAPGPLAGIGADTGIGLSRLYYNANFQRTYGVDLDLRYAWTQGDWGRFRATTTATYMASLKRTLNPGTQAIELAGTYSYPRWRNVATLNWIRGSWDSQLAWNYLGSYEQFYQVSAERVSAWNTFDLQVNYNGFRKTQITVGATNILNEEPPWSDEDWQGFDTEVASPRGAFWYLRARYTFF
jgi:outer membrane receptor protein involved in Fe transport